MATKLLPFKIQDVHRKERCGVVVGNYSDLLTKACQKLHFNEKFLKNLRVCVEEDGTDVSDDDFLMSLPANTALVVLQPGEVWMGYLSYVMAAFEQIKKIHPLYQVKERIERSLNIEKDYEKMSAISNFVVALDNKREMDSRIQDPSWFRDLPISAKSKEQVMRSSAKSRVRSYFYDARRAVQAAVTPSVYKEVFDSIFQNFHATLVENEFYADYFGRRAAVEIRLCDAAGWFNCQGPFDADTCPSLHLINPYDNKECRIVFSTWNLDHQIEKSRQVVPALLAAATAVPKGAMVNCNFFYGLLFTTANLRLVHIACHKKCEHATKVVEEKDYHIQLNTGNTSKINSVLAKAPRSARKTMKTPTKVETRGRV